MDKAIKQCDRLEKSLLKRIKTIYEKAHEEIRRELIRIDKVLKGIYEGTITVAEDSTISAEIWKQGWEKEQKKLKKMLADMANILNRAGADSVLLIRDKMVDYYDTNRQFTIDGIESAINANTSFALYDKHVIDIILQDNQPVFSKIAYQNLGNDVKLVGKLQDEFTRAILLGEGTKDIAKRLNKIVAYKYAYQAQRLAQTERTRVQNQARYDTAKEAESMGIVITKKWSATLVNTRDTHKDLNNEEVPLDEPFHLSDGDVLEYPGDPQGRPENIINCHCVLITDVVLDESRLIIKEQEGENWLQAVENKNYLQDVLSDKEYEKWEKSLDGEEKEQLQYYCGEGYRRFNGFLRGKEHNLTDDDIEKVDVLIKALSRYKISNDVIVYRGTNHNFSMEGIEVGKSVILDKGFMSASFSSDIAKEFDTSNKKDFVFLKIRIPKGKKAGAYVGKHSNLIVEQEFLLLPNTKFKIVDVKMEQGADRAKLFFDVEVE